MKPLGGEARGAVFDIEALFTLSRSRPLTPSEDAEMQLLSMDLAQQAMSELTFGLVPRRSHK